VLFLSSVGVALCRTPMSSFNSARTMGRSQGWPWRAARASALPDAEASLTRKAAAAALTYKRNLETDKGERAREVAAAAKEREVTLGQLREEQEGKATRAAALGERRALGAGIENERALNALRAEA
jgi:hypothetical protein